MLTVTLKPELAEQITHFTNGNQSTVEAFVDQAVREHLHEMARQKIRAETKAFEQQREMLLATYLGQYVAVHDAQVIDHDADLLTLHLRIFERLGDIAVLLKKVTTEPEQDLVVRSPRFVREVY
ncbi:MAG: hypothetical protein ACPGWR_01215 [Ardenticatenaceae bacterium]